MAAAAAVLDEQTQKKVVRQVEFYFSDSNLPRDTFLKNCIEDSQDGKVSLSLICSFKRMKEHLGLKDVGPDTVPKDVVAAVAETLRKSSSALQVSDDGKKVGRVNKLLKPEEVLEQVDSRTIAAAPLPYDVILEDVEQFFGQHGKVNSVRLPRHVAVNRAFCGTALVEFSSEEEANAIYKLNLVYDGANLEIKSKKDFDAERKGLLETNINNDGSFEHRSTRNNWQKESGAEADMNYPKGLIIAFTLKKISQQNSGEQNDAATAASKQNFEQAMEQERTAEEAPNKNKLEEAPNKDKSEEAPNKDKSEEAPNKDKLEEDPNKDKLEEASNKDILEEAPNKAKSEQAPLQDNSSSANRSQSGEAENKEREDKITREDIKSVLKKYGTVKYVDYTMGGDSGYVRFEHPEDAQKARTAAVLAEEGGLILKTYIAMLEAVEGDQEREYWVKLRGAQVKLRGSSGNNRGRGFHGRGGRQYFDRHSRGGKYKRFGEADSRKDERPTKVQKLEDNADATASEASKAVEVN